MILSKVKEKHHGSRIVECDTPNRIKWVSEKEHVLATEEYLATNRKGCTQSRMDCNDNPVRRTFKDCSIHVKTMKRSSQRVLRDREPFQKSYSKGHWSHIAVESIVPASS